MKNEVGFADHLLSIPAPAHKVQQDYTASTPHSDWDFSPGAGMLRLTAHASGYSGVTWWSGDYVDYRGIVSIQMEDTYLRLDAVARGKCRTRTWRRGFADRTVTKLCRAFLTDLFGAPCDSGSDPEGGDCSQAPCQASQSGDAEGSASPTPLFSGDSPNG